MKLELIYAPTKPDWWRITITVVEKEDFPTVKIFQDHHDYPAGPDYVLFPSNCNYITNVLSTETAVKRWTDNQVNALAAALLQWRSPRGKEVQLRYI